MAKKWLLKSQAMLGKLRDLLDEKAFGSPQLKPLSRIQRFLHFWVRVGNSFSRNRCPSRASALAYTTLLALVPMIFVVVSVSSSILRQEGGQRVNQFIDHLLISMTPPITVTNGLFARSSTNFVATNINSIPSTPSLASITNTSPTNLDNVGQTIFETTLSLTNSNLHETNSVSTTTYALAGRQELVRKVNDFIESIQTGTLGVTGIAGLIIAAILMLRSIESTFNDIWGVTQGRSWGAQLMQYSALLLLGPTLLAVALGLTSSQHMASAKELMNHMPFISKVLLKLSPVALLCLAFSAFYMVMPHTKVHWDAALVGGMIGGVLWHLNNYLSVLYVSRWVTNSKIYGSLAVIPIFMAGLYISWLIVLFGAQVAYAYQNRAAYLQERQSENINQRGREFIALRLMEYIGMRFQRAEPPASICEIADRLAVPSRLVQQIMQNLLAARLVVEIAGTELAYTPARPLEQITCHDILMAMRSALGHQLDTRDEPARIGVYGEFERIMEAERQAAAAVTLRAMVDRTEYLVIQAGKEVKAVGQGK